MAGKRVITVEKQDRDTVDITEYLRSIGDEEITIKLYKYQRYPQKPEWIEDMPFDTLKTSSLEGFFKENHGSGSYLVRASKGGKWIKDGSAVVHIAASKEEIEEEKKAKAKEESVNGNGNGKTTSDLELVKLQFSMQQQAAERQTQMMQSFQTSIMGILTALITSNKPMDPSSIISMMKDLNSNNGSSAMIGTMKEMFGLAKELMPGGGGNEPLDPLMALATATIPKLLEARSVAAAPPVFVQQPNPAVAAIPAETPKEIPAPAARDPRTEMLTLLKAKAKLGKDVSFWADYIEENQDDAGCIWILQIVRGYPWEQVTAALTQVDAELAAEPVVSWLQQLYTELKGETAIAATVDSSQ